MKTRDDWDVWLFSLALSTVPLAGAVGLGGLLLGWFYVDLYTYYQCQVNLNQEYCEVRELRGPPSAEPTQ